MDASYIRKQFDDNWLPPLKGKYVNQQQGIRIEGTKSKSIYLVFEEGSFTTLSAKEQRAIVKELKGITKDAGANKIIFQWYVLSHGERTSGAEYLKNMKLGDI